MLTSLGPFPIDAVILLLAWALAAGVAAGIARRLPEPRPAVAPALLDALLVGVLAARVGFVLRWWRAYLADPWAVLRLGDGGYLGWLGVLAALAFLVWRIRRQPALRQPLAWGAGVGLAVWLGLGLLHARMLAGAVLPAVTLELQTATTPAARTDLAALAGGRPLVVNLWATWCPPCRREMPVLARAQAAHPQVAFVFANQGETPAEVAAFLQRQPFALQNVVRDPASALMQAAGSRGLPTTLFYDARGHLVQAHMGELTEAGLARQLQALQAR
ncbi:redoxin family protein [Thermomonas flagellata]|uniref:redoxin family protein n=1 Tax=Thermomonas flagellata TaxID=2888524 RepID=UPI001F037075|nr:redoxin family protein [Thermomonas flagellata]